MEEICGEIIREAISVCPVCLDRIPGFVIEKDNQVLLKKECPKHGHFAFVLSSSPSYYRRLDRMYFAVDPDRELLDVTLYVTGRCNMRCPICFLSCNSDKDLPLGEPPLGDIENFIQRSQQKFFQLSGGEPTCREDLPEIIKFIRRSGKAVSLNTNGIRLADKEYVLLLKKAGLQLVNISLSGFSDDAEVKLRGVSYLSQKLQAIANINEAGIAVGLNVVLTSGLNEHYFGSILEFIARQPHLVCVDFVTVSTLGSAGSYPTQDCIMPDQAVDMFVSELKEKFSKEKIFLFQMLHWAVSSFFRQRFCFYSQTYMGVKTKEGYLPIDAFLNFQHLDFWLQKYEIFYKKNRWLSGAVLSMGILSLFCSKHSWQLAGELFLLGAFYLARDARYLRTSRLFYIKFGTVCDPCKIDYRIAKNCEGMACACGSGDRLKYQGWEMDFFINRERSKQR